MEISEQKNCTIFSALVETIHKKDRAKLRFAKCQECGRMTPFRLVSVSSNVVECKSCGNRVPLKSVN